MPKEIARGCARSARCAVITIIFICVSDVSPAAQSVGGSQRRRRTKAAARNSTLGSSKSRGAEAQTRGEANLDVGAPGGLQTEP